MLVTIVQAGVLFSVNSFNSFLLRTSTPTIAAQDTLNMTSNSERAHHAAKLTHATWTWSIRSPHGNQPAPDAAVRNALAAFAACVPPVPLVLPPASTGRRDAPAMRPRDCGWGGGRVFTAAAPAAARPTLMAAARRARAALAEEECGVLEPARQRRGVKRMVSRSAQAS